MKKLELQDAAKAKFEAMAIPFVTLFQESICALVDRQLKSWLGFLKVDLLNPKSDGLIFLKEDHIFTFTYVVMKMSLLKLRKAMAFHQQ